MSLLVHFLWKQVAFTGDSSHWYAYGRESLILTQKKYLLELSGGLETVQEDPDEDRSPPYCNRVPNRGLDWMHRNSGTPRCELTGKGDLPCESSNLMLAPKASPTLLPWCLFLHSCLVDSLPFYSYILGALYRFWINLLLVMCLSNIFSEFTGYCFTLSHFFINRNDVLSSLFCQQFPL